jgi:hypothetical protein
MTDDDPHNLPEHVDPDPGDPSLFADLPDDDGTDWTPDDGPAPDLSPAPDADPPGDVLDAEQ